MQKKRLGLIGYPLGHSFSAKYFADKFQKEEISDVEYVNFELSAIEQFPALLTNNHNIIGLNVTIPYKETVIPFLDALDTDAKNIGAVNTIKLDENRKLTGYNTDWWGFTQSIKPFLEPKHNRALILGTGGSSKAVAYALEKLGVQVVFATRGATQANAINYAEISQSLLDHFLLVVNCTPLGTWPNVNENPPVDTSFIGENHLVYDLIYNPAETILLKESRENGAITLNGLDMLKQQAEKAWEIFRS
ncbi:MAG: shikimate dehydrogenase family protein [Luteibaculaceae bacterium]